MLTADNVESKISRLIGRLTPMVRHPAGGEAGHEGGGFPVPMGHADAQAFAVPAAPMATRLVGRGPGLVDEDEPVGVEVELRLEPRLRALRGVGAVLLAGVGCRLWGGRPSTSVGEGLTRT